jgi:6-phosphogluconolactonase
VDTANTIRSLALATIALALVACGGGDDGRHSSAYTLSGSISGLAGAGLVLQDGDGHTLSVPARATSFAFATALPAGTTYSVSVKTEPGSPSQTCSVSNGSGTLNSDVISVTLSCTTNTFTVGGIVAGVAGTGLTLGDGNGGVVAAPANGAHAFVAFTFPTARPSGTSYRVSVLTQPTSNPAQFCSVMNASGNLTNGNVVNVEVTCVGPVVYVANQVDATISAYAMNVSNGSLSSIAGTPFRTDIDGNELPAIDAPFNMVIDSGKKFAYAANSFHNDVTVFSIDAASGALEPIAGSPFPTGLSPNVVTIHPSGKFAYTANSESYDISAFTVDAVTGALAAVTGSPFAAGSPLGSTASIPISSVTIDPSGKFAYVLLTNGVLTYDIDANSGALTPLSANPTSAGTFPLVLAIHASGKFLYVVATDGLYGFTIDASNGALTAIAGNPYTAPFAERMLTIDPSNRFIYVTTSLNDPTLSPGNYVLEGYAIDAVSGALSALPGSPYQLAAGTTGSLIFGPGERFAYLGEATSSPSIELFSVNLTTGELTSVSNSQMAGGPFMQFDPSGKFIYSAVGSSMYGSSVDPLSGGLTAWVPGTPFLLDFTGLVGQGGGPITIVSH